MERIISNKIQCKHCGEIVESKSIHEFVTCKCGACSVKKKNNHLSRSFIKSPEEDYIELSKVEKN